MTDKETLKLALEALEAGDWYINQLEMIVYSVDDDGTHENRAKVQKAVTAIKKYMAQPEQEPVAVYGYCPQCGAKGVMRERRPNGNDKCANGHTYPSSTSTPPQRTWVGLTWDDAPRGTGKSADWVAGARWAEAILREKNNG